MSDTTNLKVKTLDEMQLEQYEEDECEAKSPLHQKWCALRKSHFSRGNSTIFDSDGEDENLKKKEIPRSTSPDECEEVNPRLRLIY